MAIQLAEPSSFGLTSKTKYRYDVFLSFRGEDTRHSFTVILYNALRRKGINAFIDDKKLGKGKRISPALLRAIEKSRISIIVFSRNYATSTWCLDELAHIIQCKKEKNQLVMPIFYKVNPMDVQYQTNSFGEAMAAHENRFRNDMEKVRKWRSALSQAASLSSAWLFEDGNESGFIERIVEDAYAVLPPKRLHNTDHIVGLESCIEEVMSLLDQSDEGVCMLGIHGTGGIGKTTLAKALYNLIFYQYEGACFLFDVAEASKQYRGMVHLQQTLLSDILEERMKVGSADEGISKMKHRLSHKRVLLVLDDVDELEQLEKLAGSSNWFGPASKVIITTRNKQLLVAHHVEKAYEMKKLHDHDALELFCWHAFHLSQPPKCFEDMSGRLISYAQGLPLALRVIGSNLAQKNIEEWRLTLEQYERIPEKTIHEVLKISYDCLQDIAKSIFLDIACFCKSRMKYIEDIQETYNYGARFFIEVLVDKSLITVSNNGRFWIHELIQQMGKEIVRQEAPSNPGKRSRLWYYGDVLRVLHENLGGSNIEGIMLDPPQPQEVEWNGTAFESMSNLRILIVRNAKFSTGAKYFPSSLRLLDWDGYPSMTLPPDFYPENLVCFKLSGSHFRLGETFKRFEHVTYMDFSRCESIIEIPDMSQFQNLKKLLFNGCNNLIKVDDSVGSLSNLVELDVSACPKLRRFPREINMASLVSLQLSYCKNLDYFPNIDGKMDALRDIFAVDTAIKELPHSVGNLSGLQIFDMSSCKSLRELPNSLFMLQSLSWLELGDTRSCCKKSIKKLEQQSQQVNSCTNLEILNLENCCLLDEDLHLTLNCFQNLEILVLSGNDFVSLPECIKECANLLNLEVNNCKNLRHIPELPLQLEIIKAENCTSLTSESLSRLWSQAMKEINDLEIRMPATLFPDWFDSCCKGGSLSFHARGNFPVVALAFEFGKENANARSKNFCICLNIKSCNIEKKISSQMVYGGREGHVFLFNPIRAFERDEWKSLNRFLKEDWNYVEIEAICDPPDLSIINSGVYIYRQLTNMENVQFKSPLLFLNAPGTSLKRRATASPNEPIKKFNQEIYKEV